MATAARRQHGSVGPSGLTRTVTVRSAREVELTRILKARCAPARPAAGLSKPLTHSARVGCDGVLVLVLAVPIPVVFAAGFLNAAAYWCRVNGIDQPDACQDGRADSDPETTRIVDPSRTCRAALRLRVNRGVRRAARRRREAMSEQLAGEAGGALMQV